MTDEDRIFLSSFENGALPKNEWNQRAHVSVAYLYLREHGFDQALELMRRGVKSLNAVHGVEESATSGYNETTTVAFLRIIDSLLKAYEGAYPTRCAEEFCETHPQLMSKHVLRFFYSPERRKHPDSKVKFVEPDLAQLPG